MAATSSSLPVPPLATGSSSRSSSSTLAYPPVHLGSFGLPGDFGDGPSLPLPPSSSGSGTSPLVPGRRYRSRESSLTSLGLNGVVHEQPGDTAEGAGGDHRLPLPPMMPPRGGSPHARHVSSTISKTPSPLRSKMGSVQTSNIAQSNSSSRPSTAPTLSNIMTNQTSKQSQISPTFRPLGPSLTVHIPAAPFLSSAEEDGVVVKESPSIARRRTVVTPSQMSQSASRASPGGSMEDFNPSPTASPPNRVERGSLIMPIAHPTPATPGTPNGTSKARRLEKKRSSGDLRDLSNTSPTSPTPKRALPRPPNGTPSRVDEVAGAPGVIKERQRTASGGETRLRTPGRMEGDTLSPGSSRMLGSSPGLRVERSPGPTRALEFSPRTGLLDSSPVTTGATSGRARLRNASPSTPATQLTQTSTRVTQIPRSAIPVVAGLADAGPYAGALATSTTRPTEAGPSAPRASKPAAEEGICLECMMRDRDLADVDVHGEGVWERQSDADFEGMKNAEEGLLGSSSECSMTPSLESDDEESLPSTGHSVLDDARRRRKEMRAIRRRGVDDAVLRMGWKLFKWEDRLPEGFRGTKPGSLTEKGIKMVMLKFPSSSAHRAENLDKYLYQQAILVREIRAEAQKRGSYPDPDNYTPVISPRSSSVEWEAKHVRDLSAHMNGLLSPTRTPLLPLSSPNLEPPASVRPSPSSPAELSTMARTMSPKTLDRPQTHYYPEREPRIRERNMSTISALSSTPKPRLLDEYDENDDDLWPPPSENGLRPFSFAVRAAGGGGAGSVHGSDGHGGRRSIFSKFGGSMTSLFGGSQGGSGSMVDMHLGLDADRHGHPRTASLASPPRQSFFTRSRASSFTDQEKRIAKSISTSRLSQVVQMEDQSAKGFKGFLRKMKPKKKDGATTPALSQSSELAPPPPMSYLENPNRNRSGSSSSMLTDTSGSVFARGGIRSVSAPLAGSSSGGSQSTSPTSSRFNRRESTGYTPGIEMLSVNNGAEATLRGPHRPHHKNASSWTDTTLVSPPANMYPNTFSPHALPSHGQYASPVHSMNGPTSPNRYKTLPPVPPSQMGRVRETSPDFGLPMDFPHNRRMEPPIDQGMYQRRMESPAQYNQYNLQEYGRRVVRSPEGMNGGEMYSQPDDSVRSVGSFGVVLDEKAFGMGRKEKKRGFKWLAGRR